VRCGCITEFVLGLSRRRKKCGPRYARGRYAAGALRARDGPQGTVGNLNAKMRNAMMNVHGVLAGKLEKASAAVHGSSARMLAQMVYQLYPK